MLQDLSTKVSNTLGGTALLFLGGMLEEVRLKNFF
jgi:hypothetical protein